MIAVLVCLFASLSRTVLAEPIRIQSVNWDPSVGGFIRLIASNFQADFTGWDFPFQYVASDRLRVSGTFEQEGHQEGDAFTINGRTFSLVQSRATIAAQLCNSTNSTKHLSLPGRHFNSRQPCSGSTC